MEKISVSITPKTFLTAFLLVVGVFVAWKLRSFLMVVLVSVIIASFVEAGTRTLKKIRVPRALSVFIIYILGFAVITGILYLIVPLFVHEIAQFIDLFPEGSYAATVLRPLAESGFNSVAFKELLSSNTLIPSGSAVGHIFQDIFGGLLNAVLVAIISFYLSIQEKGVEQFLRVVTPEKYEEYVVDVWQRTERKIGYWFGGQVIVAALVALVTYVGLFLMGVPYALILAALAGLFVFVPFGTAFSVAPASVLGYLAGGVGLALQIFIFYVIVHYIESYLFTPYIIHRTIGMPMLVIILSFIACFELFGIIGLLIAVPIAVFFLELIYDHQKFKKGLGKPA